MRLRTRQLFHGPITLNGLESKVSATFLSLGALATASAVSTLHASNFQGDDLPPSPGPELPPDPGDDDPIEYPLLPPSGPAGPGSLR
jgi:hypothetical protein